MVVEKLPLIFTHGLVTTCSDFWVVNTVGTPLLLEATASKLVFFVGCVAHLDDLSLGESKGDSIQPARFEGLCSVLSFVTTKGAGSAPFWGTPLICASTLRHCRDDNYIEIKFCPKQGSKKLSR